MLASVGQSVSGIACICELKVPTGCKALQAASDCLGRPQVLWELCFRKNAAAETAEKPDAKSLALRDASQAMFSKEMSLSAVSMS